MDYRPLGRSALRVSPICLGTMNFGPRTPEAEAHDILDAAVDAGVNFIDTANQYGGALGVGTTESILGRWLAARPARRDRLVLATKVHEPMSEDVNDRGLSARHIRAVDESLARLGVDHIDLYQMHHVDRAAPVEEIWEAMDRFHAEGKVTYFGTSNFPGWDRSTQRTWHEPGASRPGVGAEPLQPARAPSELEVLPAVAPAVSASFLSPLAGGALAGPDVLRNGRRADAAVRALRETHAWPLRDMRRWQWNLELRRACLRWRGCSIRTA